MHSRIVILLLLDCVLAAAGLHAAPSSPPAGGGPEVLFHNDAFGPGPVSEWDDLRTFGFDMHTPLAGPFGIDAGYNSLTWRGATASDATRIDTLRALLSGKLPRLSLGGGYAEATLEGGFALAGNLGGKVMQESVHGNIGISRPVPETYDSFSAIAPAAALLTRIGWSSGIWDLAFLGSAEGELGMGGRVSAGLRASAGPERGGLSITLRELSDTARGVSPTLDQVSLHESGTILGMECAAGRMRTSLQYNLSSGVSEGSYGMQFGREPSSLAALPMALEMGTQVDSVSPGQRVLFSTGDTRLRWYASQASGWWSPPNGAAVCQRFSDYGAGVEGRILAPLGWLELEAGLGAGPFLTAVTEQSASAPRSSAMATAWMAGLRVTPVIRVGVLEGGDTGHVLKSGAGLECSLNAPLTAGVSGQAHWVTVEIFLFSETR